MKKSYDLRSREKNMDDSEFPGLTAAPEQWDAFLRALARPARKIPELARLFSEPTLLRRETSRKQ